MACNIVLNSSKNILMMDLQTSSLWPHKDWMDWSGLGHCDVFISCLDSHSDGTHSLQSIHWWANDAMLHFSQNQFPWRNNPISLVYLVNYCFKTILQFKVNMTSNPALKLGILGYKWLAYFAFLSYAFSFICIYKLKINKLNQLVPLTVHCSSETSQDHLKNADSCVSRSD